MSQNTSLANFLNQEGLSPTLVDVGSSGYRHKIWDPISSSSRVIGFDPDSRHFDPEFSKAFEDSVLVSKAVVADDTSDEAEFILTEYPSCSSVLEGDIEALEPFMFRDYFKEVRRASVPATSLNRVIADLAIKRLDWIKIDAQGFDLMLVESLSPENLAQVTAIDIEPGFIDAYRGEALFPAVHSYMTQQGFWLSDLQYQAYPRVTHKNWHRLLERTGSDPQNLIRKTKGTPTAAEARYLRDVRLLEKNDQDTAELLKMLFAFSMLDGHSCYCLDVVDRYAAIFGEDDSSRRMNEMVDQSLTEALK